MYMVISILSMVSWVWLIVIAFKNESTLWGIGMIVFPPACLVFGALRWSIAAVPFIMFIVSIGLIFTLSPSEIEALKQQ